MLDENETRRHHRKLFIVCLSRWHHKLQYLLIFIHTFRKRQTEKLKVNCEKYPKKFSFLKESVHLTENLTDNIRIEDKPRRCRKQKETVSDSTFTFFWFRGQIPEIMKIVKPVVYVKMHFILKQLVHAYQDAWDPGLPTLTLSLKHWSWQNKSIPGELHSATLMGDLKVVGTHSIYFLLLQIIYLSSHLSHTHIGPLFWY